MKHLLRPFPYLKESCESCHSSITKKTATDPGKQDAETDFSAKKRNHEPGDLRTRREAGIDTCRNCHPRGDTHEGASHPVGSGSKGNIVIPGFLPTAEEGMMTCATCHTPHGGNRQNLARLDFEKDFRVLCHGNEQESR